VAHAQRERHDYFLESFERVIAPEGRGGVVVVADGSIATQLLEHSDEDGTRVQAMKAPRILHPSSLPRNGHRKEERIEPRVVESLTDVAAGCDEQSALAPGETTPNASARVSRTWADAA
jgi:hypothetical protein